MCGEEARVNTAELGLHSQLIYPGGKNLSEQLSNKTTSDATLDGLSVGWTQDGPDYGFYATVYCFEQDTLDKT